jgi:hypothetical protein
MTANTNTQVNPRGLKYKIHQEFFDFIPGFEKQAAEFKKAILHDYEERFTKKGKKGKGEVEETITYPYVKSTLETAYENWIEKVVNEKTRTFFPAKDEDNRAIPNTGAYRTIRAIQRVKLADGSEFLITKSDLHGYDAFGEPVNFFASSIEKWIKTIFRYKTVVNPRTMQPEKVFDGVGGTQEVYELPFNKENLSELWNQRESDLIQLTVKDEPTGDVRDIKDVTGNAQKSFELLRDSDFDYLFKANYIPEAIKEELRKEAIGRGLISGNVSDYSSNTRSNTNKNVYK